MKDQDFADAIRRVAGASDDEWSSTADQFFPPSESAILLLNLLNVIDILTADTTAALTPNSDDEALGMVDQRWVRVQNLYRLRGFPREAHFLITRLYPLMRTHEISRGRRWHKGSPFWFMGTAALNAGSLVEARLYLILAMLEDVFAHVFADGKDPRKLPAFAWLSRAVGYTPAQVDALFTYCVESVTKTKGWDPTEPERSYIRAICRVEYLMEDLATLPFISVVAQALLNWALTHGGTTEERGEALEVVVCYLFETSTGFRAAMRAKGPDAENDLLIRNGNEAGPLKDLGRFIIGQCKNTKYASDAAMIREFLGRLSETGCHFGVFVNPTGITGRRTRKGVGADRVLLKAQQRTGQVVSVLSRTILDDLCAGRRELPDTLTLHCVSERFDLFMKG